MCGIAGIVSKTGSRYDESVMRSMLSSIAHRGPDDEGLYANDSFIVGHRRLSIIDVSEQGHQPMHYKQFTIVFNGEIYNYLELREQLLKLGHVFTTKTDTEVILHAYEEWGEQCLQKFRGMWAFAIADAKRNKLFCSRDRFGIKPFYYYNDSERFLFASELKALLTAGIPAHANMDTVLVYLVVGYSHMSENTFFREIYQLPCSHYAWIDLHTGQMDIHRYYDLSIEDRSSIDASHYADAFEESVKLHLRSDVQVGTCLSGGLDSSTLAAVSASFIQQEKEEYPYIAVTAQSEASYNDESHYAKQVVDHCSLQWELTKPTYRDFADNIEQCLRVHDEPVGGPSMFMQYWVMRAAKKAGIKVILDGQGGDETLLGYERYYPSFFWYLLTKGNVVRMLKEYYLASKHSKLTLKLLSGYMVYFLIVSVRKKVLSRRASSYVKKENIERALKVFDTMGSRSLHIGELQKTELLQYQMPKLLQYEDRNSMAHSIEARVPFVDHVCVETALSLPHENKIKNGYTKYALRLLADRILPQSIAWRRNKYGFEAPDKVWLVEHLPIMQGKVDASKLIREICAEVPDLSGLPLEIRWRLYNIAVWEEQHNVS